MSGDTGVLAPPGLLRKQIPSHGLVFIALLAIVGLFVLYPVLIILVNSVTLGPNGQSQGFTLRSWQIAISDPAMLAAIRNTLKLVAALASANNGIVYYWVNLTLTGQDDIAFLYGTIGVIPWAA